MSIVEDQLAVVTVGELLQEDLRIPNYQRPYSWEAKHALQLLVDVQDSKRVSGASNYALGSVILYRAPGASHVEVVDGQQRLLTLQILRPLLRRLASPAAGAAGDSNIAQVNRLLTSRVASISDDEAAVLANYIDTRCVLVRIVTDDEDEAFRFFDAQNYRGKALRPHDLLKAHHLREMHGESESIQTAVVEKWEDAGESALEQLFAKYLFRISRWSRNQDARVFSVRDIDLFKGISATHEAPGTVYHRVAQSVLPLLSSWEARRPGEDGNAAARAIDRSRFQLDVPVVAGRTFFEMVSFMLREVDEVDKRTFDSNAGSAQESATTDFARFRDDHRYRYVAELLLCAMLFYRSKFGDQDFIATRNKLFLWAYSMRLDYLRVAWRSVNNYALGRGTVVSPNRNAFNVFAEIRNSVTDRGVDQLHIVPPEERRDDSDADLLALMRSIEGRE